MTTITTDHARAGQVSKNHRVLKILTTSLAISLAAMVGMLMLS